MRRKQSRSGFLGAALVGVLAAAGLPGCGNNEKGPEILCTTGMVADVVRNVAGEHHSVGQLFGEGVDPHTYDPTPAVARKLQQAKIIFYSGLGLEGKMRELFADMARRKPTYAVADDLDPALLLKDAHGATDSHVWFDVALWARTVDPVCAALEKFDPAHAGDFRANAKAYKEKLARLHEEVKKDLAAIPRERRALVTAHDAFQYFGRAYNIDVRGIQGISTDDEASVREVNRLVAFITRRKVKAVFTESSVSPKNIEALKEGCEKNGHKVIIGGELFSDAPGKEGTPEGTYEGMVRHNVRVIVSALK